MTLSSFQNHCLITNKTASAPQFFNASSAPSTIKKIFAHSSPPDKGDLGGCIPTLFIEIPANHKGTLEFTNDSLGTNSTLGIVVGPHAQITLIENHAGTFKTGAEQIIVTTGAESTVDYLLATEHMGSFDGTYKAIVGQESIFTWHLLGTVEKEHRLHFSIHHPHQGSTGYINGALRSIGKSKITLNLLNHHEGTHTGGEIHFRGIGTDEARAGVSGLVMIDKDAAFTNSHFFANVLSLSPKSHVEAEPNLEILNNEVKCTHAAAIGSIDDEAVHYLASRGISPEEAQKLITKGFLRALLPYVKNERVAKELEKWMKK